MMGTEIFNFDASLAEILTKTRVSFLAAPTVEWTTGNGILMSSSHWPIYNKVPPGIHHLYFILSHLNIVFCLQKGFGSRTFHKPLYESYRHLTLEIFLSAN